MKVILCQAVGDSSLPDSFHGFKYHSYTHAKNVYDAINVIKVGYGALYFLEIALTTQLLYSNVVYCCLVSNGLIIFFGRYRPFNWTWKFLAKLFHFSFLEDNLSVLHYGLKHKSKRIWGKLFLHSLLWIKY